MNMSIKHDAHVLAYTAVLTVPYGSTTHKQFLPECYTNELFFNEQRHKDARSYYVRGY